MQRGGLSLTSTTTRAPAGGARSSDLEKEALSALKRTFGFDAFRGKQLQAIVAALQGKDCFVLMPTGGGKSLCYALVPAIRSGVVLVVSPLIALMQDQVQSFRARGLRADFLSSTRTEGDRRRLLDDMQQANPSTQLLYVTPELLATDSFLRCLRNAYAAGSLLLCAVDEAHAISSWGHSFRHTYRRLCVVRQELPRLPIMALTATASERVQADVVAQLRLRQPLMLRTSFNRPNIRYEVRYLELLQGPEGQPLSTPLPDIIKLLEGAAGSRQLGHAKQGQDHQQLQSPQQQAGQQQQAQQSQSGLPCTVIYCHRREDADRVAGALRRRSMPAAAYHAGLSDATRAQVLADWQAKRLQVVAATVAFGMGIDRADVRYVIHYSLPKSLEAYYQEAGRGGRDGRPAHSLVYFSTEDRQRQEFVLSKGDERDGKRRAAGRDGPRGDGGDERHPNQLQQFGQVVDYCLSPSCRRATVLRHFGERPPPHCLMAGPAAEAARQRCCDVCTDSAAVEAAVRELASAGAQRRQRFAGSRHRLDFGGGGGGGGALEFETSRPHEGLDYDQERTGHALQESDGEDAIAGSSGDEGAKAATAAMQHAARGRSTAAMLAAMQRAEERHGQEQPGSKRARLLQKLEGGGSGGKGGSRVNGGSSGGGGPSSSGLPDALLQTAAGQLARLLSGNTALAADIGGSTASVAAVLVSQLAAGTASKPVFQSKLSNLAMQLKKAGAAAHVPALAAVIGHDCGGSSAEQSAEAPAAGAAVEHADAAPAQQQQPSQQQFQQQVDVALQLAAATASPADSLGDVSAGAAPAEAATAALHALAAAPVSVDLLQATGAGRRLQQLRKHAVPAVAAAAAAVVAAWKARLTSGGGQ